MTENTRRGAEAAVSAPDMSMHEFIVARLCSCGYEACSTGVTRCCRACAAMRIKAVNNGPLPAKDEAVYLPPSCTRTR